MVSATLVCGQNKAVPSFSKLPLDKKCAYFIEISNEERTTQLAVVEKELQKIDKDNLNKKNRIYFQLSQGLIEKIMYNRF